MKIASLMLILTLAALALLFASATNTFAQLTTTIPAATPILKTALTTPVQVGQVGQRKLTRVLCYNPNAAVSYVQLFNATTANVTLGTTAPLDVVPLAATSSNGWTNPGESYPIGIVAAATTTPTGATAPATALVCSFAIN